MAASVKSKEGLPSMWDYLALPDAELEQADLVAMNITVAKDIDALKDLDISTLRSIRFIHRWISFVYEWSNMGGRKSWYLGFYNAFLRRGINRQPFR